MWSKLYVGIIVVLILIFLQLVERLITYINNTYKLDDKYGIPMRCFSNSLCGMNGNILLLFIIYLIIPSSYYEKLLELIDPKKLQQNADKDVLKLNKIGNTIEEGVSGIANTIKSGVDEVVNTVEADINGLVNNSENTKVSPEEDSANKSEQKK